ncbi:chain-length determining protein [Halioglobus sp. HI00S01]|uniref:chain-length determining protein n=1 Tax=Halioglobus sp. HI00S01 TaxID=1822214 RepID=UPI0007C3C3AA|nr:chain-length determining protein [Halioglobus sp. HI00S01]KZX55121.1 chain-length determining protein [Halioglobus sp. HI00S01]
MDVNQSHIAQQTAAMDMDLMPYLMALLNARWLIFASMLVFAVLTAWWVKGKPYLYESTARVSVVLIDDPGGVSPDDRRASQVLTLVEHGFVLGTKHDNYEHVIQARLGSREFTERFLEQYNVYKEFYPNQWLEEDDHWREGFIPDRGEVLTTFGEEVRRIVLDEETQILSISMVWPDAAVARDWANQYVYTFNEYMRGRTLAEVQRKQEFLEGELGRSEVVEIQQSLFRLIEAQTAIAMLANAREEYVLEVIDPAALPFRSFNMSRKKRVVIGAIAGAMLATFGVLAWVLLGRMLRTLLEYRAAHKDKPDVTSESDTSLGA